MAQIERRLAVIMFTDMVGYTALAQANESAALAALEEQRNVVRNVFPSYSGTEIKTVGDAFLLEFKSARDAVLCAVEIQKKLHELRSARSGDISLPPIRVGIHLGDVEHSGGDVYGDAVNVASRIQLLSEPNGVCISEQVYESVRNKTDLHFRRLSGARLKNVANPMDLYQITMPWDERRTTMSGAPRERLVVLPFVSMSPDPNDEYFADGLTEELIGSVSQIKGLEVIARTSAMNYKKKEKSVAEIGRELNVGTVIEGSVRKAGNRIRVTVQVIDAKTEAHLSSSNYDSTLDDIFAVQSSVAAKVAESVPGTVLGTRVGKKNGSEKEMKDTQAYTDFLQGMQLVHTRERESLRRAESLFELAISRDPDFARAYVGLARCYIGLGNGGYIEWGQAIQRGRSAVMKALSLDSNLAEAHCGLGELMFMGDEKPELRRSEFAKALELNPNLAEAYRMLANDSGAAGDTPEMVKNLEKAYELDPLSPIVIPGVGLAYFYTARYDDALNHWMATKYLAPYDTDRFLFDFYMNRGDYSKAEEIVRELERIGPTLEYTLLNRGYLAAVRGDVQTARAMIDKLDDTHKPGWARSSSAGLIYLALGDVDKFFEYMFRAVEDHTIPLMTLRYNPLLDKVRSDPRFAEIFRRAGVPYDPMELSPYRPVT